MKKYKTPLRYPGGKSRAIKFLDKHIPSKFEKYVEPFLGGGSVLFALLSYQQYGSIQINGNIYAYDYNKALINLYLSIKTDVERLIEILNDIKTEFYNISTNTNNVRWNSNMLVPENYNSTREHYYSPITLDNNESNNCE